MLIALGWFCPAAAEWPLGRPPSAVPPFALDPRRPFDQELDRLRLDCVMQRVLTGLYAARRKEMAGQRAMERWIEAGNAWVRDGDRIRRESEDTGNNDLARVAFRKYLQARLDYIHARDWPNRLPP